MTTAAQIMIAVWLAALFCVGVVQAFNPCKPAAVRLDRQLQTRMYVGLAAGAAAEALTLWTGGLWS